MAATDDEVQDTIDELNETISESADDMERFSQEQSAEIYENVANICSTRARLIREEMK